MKTKSLLIGTLVVGVFSVFAIGCESQDSTKQNINQSKAVTDLSQQSSANSVAGAATPEEVKALRAGVGCENDVDRPVIDPDLRTNDSSVKEVKYGLIGDVVTKTLAMSFVSNSDGKLHFQEKVVSVESAKNGSMQDQPTTATVTCDPQMPLMKACALDVVAAATPTPVTNIQISVNGQKVTASQKTMTPVATTAKKDNVCKIINAETTSDNDASGNFTLKNGLSVKALKHTHIVTGQIVCGDLKFGHGSVTEEITLSRDVVAVSDLVACGGAPVIRSRTVMIDDGRKVIQSQVAEVTTAPKR